MKYVYLPISAPITTKIPYIRNTKKSTIPSVTPTVAGYPGPFQSHSIPTSMLPKALKITEEIPNPRKRYQEKQQREILKTLDVKKSPNGNLELVDEVEKPRKGIEDTVAKVEKPVKEIEQTMAKVVKPTEEITDTMDKVEKPFEDVEEVPSFGDQHVYLEILEVPKSSEIADVSKTLEEFKKPSGALVDYAREEEDVANEVIDVAELPIEVAAHENHNTVGISKEPSGYLPSNGASGEDIFVLSAASILENLSQEEKKDYLETGVVGSTQNPYRYTLFDMYVQETYYF